MRRSYVSVDSVSGDPDALAVFGYPRATPRQKKARLRELSKLGIDSVSFSGPTILGRTRVLGKGYVGVVILGRDSGGRRLAIKARRTDSPRPHMRDEASLLGAANAAGVGPRLVSYSRNFLVMQYAGGRRIGDWLDALRGSGTSARFRRAARSIISDCHKLDEAGIDHGELVRISKHVIISERGDRPVIIDFESASTARRPSNVTSITQAIFISPPLAGKVRRICRVPPKDEVIASLREYKHSRDGRALARLLARLGL